MKIIIIDKCWNKEGKATGFQAGVFGVNPPLHSFAESEIKALKQLSEKLEKIDPKYIRQRHELTPSPEIITKQK